MTGVTPNGIRYPDGASKAKNLGAELQQMAEDIDTYIDVYVAGQPLSGARNEGDATVIDWRMPSTDYVGDAVGDTVGRALPVLVDDSARFPRLDESGKVPESLLPPMPAAVFGNMFPRTRNVIQDSSEPYQTIQSAVDASSDGDTIVIYPGTYVEQVTAWHINDLHLVGIDKHACVLKDSSSMYSTPPLEIGSGSVRSLTIVEDHADMPPDALDGDFEPGRAYCIHPDHPGMAGRTLVLEDLVLRNTQRTAIGTGTFEGSTVIIRGCDIWAGVPTLGGGRERGAVYFHNRQTTVSPTDNQQIIFERNTIRCDDARALYMFDSGLHGGQQSTMQAQFIGNLVWSATAGITDIIGGDGFTTDLTLHPASFGNNLPALNH